MGGNFPLTVDSDTRPLCFQQALPKCGPLRCPSHSIHHSSFILDPFRQTAVQGWSEITDLYANKFGHPPPGSWVFLWTRQVLHGRKHPLKRTGPDVPPPGK